MIDIVVAGGALLGECPVWSVAEDRLYWVDIEGRLIHRSDPATGTDEASATPGRPGSIALTDTPGRLLVASEHELGWFDWSTGVVEPWVELEEPGTGNRLNDGRCDPSGRFWVGSMYEDTSDGRSTGMLHRVEPNGSVTTVRSEVGVSNALAFSPDGRTMYWADSFRDTVWAYDYDPDDGSIREERVFVAPGTAPGKPDGACVDADGCLWVARVRGGALARFSPSGTLDRLIELPVDAPTMPAFGGTDLSTLYVTSLGGGDPHDPEAGALLALDVGIHGLPEPSFSG